jgi:hypothetical protein
MTCLGHHRSKPPATQGSAQLCDHCIEDFTSELTEISRLWDLLDTMMSTEDSPYVSDGGIRQKRIDPPAPLRMEAATLRDHRTHPDGQHQPVPAMMHHWAMLIASERDLHDVVRRDDVVSAVALILLHTDHAMRQDWIADAIPQVHACRTALSSACGEAGAPPLHGVRCPVVLPGHDESCDGPLFPTPYTLGLRCPRCRSQWLGLDELGFLSRLVNESQELS